MSWKNSLAFRVTALFRNSKLEDEMDQEMRSHFEFLVDDYLAQGHDETTARQMARRDFGNLDRAKEECRDTWGTRLIFDFFRDLRFAARLLAKSRNYTLVCVLTIAVAIAASSTIFSVADGVLFRPLPYHQPERIVTVWEQSNYGKNSVAGGSFLDWKANSEVAEAMMLFNKVQQNLKRNGHAESIQGTEVSSDFLEVIGVSTLLGRGFDQEDERVGTEPAVILTEEMWRKRFGAEPTIIGEAITLDEIPRKVIGILPKNSWLEQNTEYFVPAILDPSQPSRSGRSSHWAMVCARLKPGATIEQLQRELRSIKSSLNSEYPEFKRDWSVLVEPMRELISANARPIITPLATAVGFVLLIACANVSILVLARTINRQTEFAMRTALGANRGRLIRQSLTESLLLSGLGGTLGLLLSIGAIQLLRATSAEILPGALLPQLDYRVLFAAFLLSAGSSLLFGLIPSITASKNNPGSKIGDGGKSSSHGGHTRTQGLLVVGEVALTIALLSSTGLLLKSLNKQLSEYPGYNVENTITFDLNFPSGSYRGPEERLAYIQSLKQALNAVPSVQSASTLSASPLHSGAFGEFINRSDQDAPDPRPLASVIYGDDTFLDTLQAQLIAGRRFETFDNQAGSKATIVIDRKLSENLFDTESPLGKFVELFGQDWEVIGVVENMKLDPQPRSAGYAFVPQQNFPFVLSVIARLENDSASSIEAIRQAVMSIDSGIPMANTRTLKEAIENTVHDKQYMLILLSVFAGVALLLSATGIYSVMSYAVATRQGEISIRAALGASPREIKLLVVRSGTKTALLGLACGIATALALARLIASQLYQVSPYAPTPLIISTAIIAAAEFAATWIPACRIAKLDPTRGLRSQ